MTTSLSMYYPYNEVAFTFWVVGVKNCDSYYKCLLCFKQIAPPLCHIWCCNLWMERGFPSGPVIPQTWEGNSGLYVTPGVFHKLKAEAAG